ncbi:ribonuclease H2, subunit C [Trametes polyzona]|nr:ribonuclease H2, subunit C [Trametes polyzona]
MASPSIKVSTSAGPLPSMTPHLMPFHIAYSGPAPISTYFRVRDAPEPTYGRDLKATPTAQGPGSSQAPSTSDSQATLVANPSTTCSTTPALLPSSDSSATVVDVDMQTTADASSNSSSRHFAAAFRGRLMHGLKVELPKGYAGIVLRTPGDHNGQAPASSSKAADEQTSKSRSRTKTNTRSSRRAKPTAEPEPEVEAQDPDGLEGREEEGPVRLLQPTAQFSSFVLWHPDIPVDEGRDEYLRSLTEWTKLAAEIHRVDDV